MKNTKLNNEAVKQLLAAKNDPEMIYKLHMAQARDALKQFSGDAVAEAKINTIITDIKAKYEASKASKWPFPTTKRA